MHAYNILCKVLTSVIGRSHGGSGLNSQPGINKPTNKHQSCLLQYAYRRDAALFFASFVLRFKFKSVATRSLIGYIIITHCKPDFFMGLSICMYVRHTHPIVCDARDSRVKNVKCHPPRRTLNKARRAH